MKQILFVALLCMPFITYAQAEQAELVIIRILESSKGCNQKPLMHITKADGQYEVVDLEPIKSLKYLADQTDNQRKIHAKLQEYLGLGYEITAHSSTQFSSCSLKETYVLTK